MSEPEDAPRDIQSTTSDGHTTQFVTPSEQIKEDARKAGKKALRRNKPLINFFRTFRIVTQDRP